MHLAKESSLAKARRTDGEALARTLGARGVAGTAQTLGAPASAVHRDRLHRLAVGVIIVDSDDKHSRLPTWTKAQDAQANSGQERR